MHQVDRWQVELATCSKVAINSLVRSRLDLGTFTTIVDLHILPLGSYDIVLGMDWLAAHQANIDCHRKVVQCVDDTGGQVELLGVQRQISLRMISANQLKRSVRKGCQLFLVSLSDLEEAESRTVTLDDHPLLREYAAMFLMRFQVCYYNVTLIFRSILYQEWSLFHELLIA